MVRPVRGRRQLQPRRATTEPDWDIGASRNLYTRGCRDYVGVGSKEGIYRAFDRGTGQRVWQVTVSSGSALDSGAGGGPIAYRIGSALTVINGYLIVTEGFQFQFVKGGPGDASVGGIRGTAYRSRCVVLFIATPGRKARRADHPS